MAGIEIRTDLQKCISHLMSIGKLELAHTLNEIIGKVGDHKNKNHGRVSRFKKAHRSQKL